MGFGFRFSTRVFALFLCGLIAFPVHAGPVTLDAPTMSKIDSSQALQKGSVYVYGDQAMDLLMPVKILGGVVKAGIHYLPFDTDLLTLLSLAGGTTERASIDEITIKRTNKAGKTEFVHVNLEALFEDGKSDNPKLMPNDVILIPVRRPMLSENVVQTVGVLAGLATIFGTVVLGVTNLKK